MYNDPLAKKISLDEWDGRYAALPDNLRRIYPDVLKLSQYYSSGDRRLRSLEFDNSFASLKLWNFILSEEGRLAGHRASGKKIFGVMKDLGTVPVLVYAHDNAVAFYPEGCWWTPCFKEYNDQLFALSDSAGMGEEGCPARVTIGAYMNECHFPIPDLNIAAVGSCCSDFSCAMQIISGLGHPFLWWELPFRDDPGLESVRADVLKLPNGEGCADYLVEFVKKQLEKIRRGIEETAGGRITNEMLQESIKKTNRVRRTLRQIREAAYTQDPVPMPALETLLCEMIAIHFCSDQDEAPNVLEDILKTIRRRVQRKEGVSSGKPFRVTWVNPVADLRMMNLFEDLGGRIAGTEYLFSHALAEIPEEMPPLDALARMVLMDSMIGTAAYRSRRIIEEVKKYHAEGVLISRIPGASHCASEMYVIEDMVKKECGIPVLTVTVPSVLDPIEMNLKTKLQAFFEMLALRRKQ